MIASITDHSTNIASTILHAYHYNLSLCRCHVQPTVYQRNSYCIRDIHVTEAIRSCTPISRTPLIYGIPFTHADILIFSCVNDCSSNTVYLAWLQSSTRELQRLEYLKSVFLEIPNVTSWSVFQNQVTFCDYRYKKLLE